MDYILVQVYKNGQEQYYKMTVSHYKMNYNNIYCRNSAH